jgi:DtxR family Mn-dependent transcriptional regulator
MMESQLSRKAEDYLEAIYVIEENKGFARPRDLVGRMKVRHPSVTEMLARLVDSGMVEYEKYGEIRLTSKGKKVAEKIKARHETIEEFLSMIMVPKKVADEDACTMEHHLHPDTINQLSSFVSYLRQSKTGRRLVEGFRAHCRRQS